MTITDSKKTRVFPGRRIIFSATAALLLGAGLRLWLYLLKDSFWRDESMLLLNVAQKSFWELTGPLEYAQGGPIPVLWFYRALYLLGLGGELPMRVLSLGASLLALLLFYRLARLVLKGEPEILFSTWLLALSPGAILFAAQTKPYSLDLLIACGFLYLAAPWFLHGCKSKKSSLLFGYAALAPWFSFPAIFMAGGIAGGFLLNARRDGFSPAFILITVVSISFTWEYFTVLRPLHSVRDYMFFFNTGSLEALKKSFLLFKQHQQFLDYGLWAIIIVGLWGAGKEYGWAWAGVLIFPLAIVLILIVLQKYPVYGRLLFFAVPGLYLLIGYGSGKLREVILTPKLFTTYQILIIIVLLYTSLLTNAQEFKGIRHGLVFIDSHQQQDDIIICDTYAFPTVAYYRLLGLNKAALNCKVENFEKLAWGKRTPWEIEFKEILPFIPPERRVWCLAETTEYTRVPSDQVLDYWQKLTDYLSKERNLLRSFIADKVAVKEFSRKNRE